MQRKKLLLYLLTCIFLLAVLHIAAIQFYFYWMYWWFDIIMHFLGGYWIGLSALWFIFLSGYLGSITANISKKSIIFISLFSVLIIGLSWEIFEIVAGVPVTGNYALDTSIDLVMDLIGGFAASTFFKSRYAY